MNFHRHPVTYVDQVHVKVQDLDRSVGFYEKVIGFKVLDKTERKASLTVDGKTALLTIEQPKNVTPKQGRTTGLYHFALLLPNRSDLANVVQYFAQIGIQFGSSDHLVSEAIYLSDPDGNGIEMYVDRNPSVWNWQNGEVEMAVDPLNFQALLSERTQQQWVGLPQETVMGHIHLHVAELRKTEEFYTKGLGFEVVCRFGSQALFIADSKYHHHLGLNTWAGVGAPPTPPNSAGLESFTLKLPSEEKRREIILQLKDLGASVEGEKDSYITVDPSGNRINLAV
ncbi:VOC family protein [Salirhabdus salicampi]|uniref:VOC family protein n=1 Tax=Salirhabdus salicampi TaxID=476102 RepID=UPI0020C2B2CF|nr:VOC family protein [Salirhabdus salicampi]MCP8615360.1 VOC family protein [Salirhabdus salicampi]